MYARYKNAFSIHRKVVLNKYLWKEISDVW
jgi:hypothetical protein